MTRVSVRRYAALSTCTAALVAGAAFGANPALAAVTHHVYRTCTTAGGCGLWLRSAPSTTASHLGLMYDGDTFSVNCWQLGPTVINDPVWLNGVWKGKTGWAADYYIDTHWSTTADLTKQGIPKCGSTAPPPSGITTTETKAVTWAKGYLGKTAYVNWCLAFVSDAYIRGAGFPITSYTKVVENNDTYPQDVWNAGFTHGHTGGSTTTPPYGALVFYLANSGQSKIYSHVALSVGGGNTISTSDVTGTAIHYETLSQHAAARPYNHYVGWWLPDK